jgi:hypothetical protein
MNVLRFDDDIRSREPNDTGHRRARFREGFRKGAAGDVTAKML